MTDALTFFVKPKDAPAGPVAPISQAQIEIWAMETELLDGDGVISANGTYFINLMSVNTQQLADKNTARFHQAGFATDIEEAEVAGTLWYRLRINGLASKQDAEKLAATLQAKFNLGQLWINRA